MKLIQERISCACAKAGRKPEEVTLVAVSKTHPPEAVDALARLGVMDFGENKIQEAKAKIPLCDGRLRWHGIGHLQTNKVRDAVHLFSMIHAVDSIRLVEELEKQAEIQSKFTQILLEVNVSGERSKFGLKPEEVAGVISRVQEMRRLQLRGLMTMAPYSEKSEDSRPFFAQLRKIKLEMERQLGIILPDLSMGMSGDFEVAIEEGATLIRVGTALFGERKASAFRKTIEEE